MNNSAAQRLPQAWEAYRSICRDCLEQKRTQGALSAAAATLAVRTAEHVWYDETSPCGQWLADVAAVDELAASRVLDSVRSFQFIEFTRSATGGSWVAPAAAGVAIGLGLSLVTGALALALQLGWLASAGAGVLAALVAGSVATVACRRLFSRDDEGPLAAYLDQLEILHEDIKGILPD